MTTPPLGRRRSWTPMTHPARIADRRFPRTSWAARGVTALALVAAQLAVAPPLPAAAMRPVGNVATRPAASADVTDGLALWYKLDETSGTAVADSSGHHRDAVVTGTPGWTAGQGLGFNGSNTYVTVPANPMAGLDAITVAMDVQVDPALSGSYFIYGFGNTASNGWGNGYLFATGNDLRTAVSTANWTAEQNTRPNPARNLVRGTFRHVTYTQAGSTGILYEDGVEVGRNTNVTIKPGAIGDGKTAANYLGRSLYTGDPLFKGRLRDFRVYDRAITAAEAARLAAGTAAAGVAQDRAALNLGDTDAVTDDLALPAPGAFGSTITYASSDPSVLGNDGRVTRPGLGRPDATVTLTATLRRGAAQDTKVFTVKVLAEFDDSTKVDKAVQALSLPHIDDVRGNLTLPDTGLSGTTVTWTSDRPAVIGTDGIVHRPAAGEHSVRVNLIATAHLNQASASRTFEALVPPLPAKQAFKGYLFSYFTGESRADGEQIYLALSKGNDPLKFRELNGGKPVLTSTIGDKGVRDPFIIRSPEGDKFYQIATDLRIFGNGNWDAAQRTGSKSIIVWESTDLVNWTDPRPVKVSPDTAGNTWAPEAFYDRGLGAYVVFWASKIYAADDPGHTGNTNERIMYATTRDFRTFSPAKPYIEQNSQGQTGKSVIDTTMIEHNGSFYRYTKDEEDSSKYAKMIFQQKGDGVLGTWRNIGTDGSPIPRAANGGRLFAAEGPTAYKSNTEDKWYLLLDDFGGGGYKPFVSTDLDSGVWTPATGAELPSSPRHGTVLPVTQAEYDRILRKYAPGELVDHLADVDVRTPVGTAPKLPDTVTATFADDSTKDVAVTWENVDPSRYATPGTFTVTGTIAQSDTVPAKATVKVFVPDAADAGRDVSGAEGSAIALTGTAVGDGARSWTVRALTGVDSGARCTVADPGAAHTTVACTDDGAYELTLHAGAAFDTALLTVTNAAPVIGAVTLPAGATPGQSVTVRAPFTDAGGNDTHTCTVDWNDGNTRPGTVAGGVCTASHPYAAAGTFAVAITVTDDDGGSGTAHRSTTITPISTADAGADVHGVEGATIALTGAATGAGAPGWTYRALSGVDAGASCSFVDAHAARTTVTCTDDGTYELKLTSGTASDTARLTVTNAAPALGRVTVPGSVSVGKAVRLTAPFTDAGLHDTHTCVIDWHDARSHGTVSGGTCTAGHFFQAAGGYDVTVTVTDDDGGSASRTVRVVVKAGGSGLLARTGAPIALVAGVGGLLLVCGAVLFLLGRRRSRTTDGS